jgi:hypothetical protein
MQSLLGKLGFAGLVAGPAQAVAEMAVVPLLREKPLTEALAAPQEVAFKQTRGYGTMAFYNAGDKPGLVPNHLAVLTKRAAQDHAMMSAGLVAPKQEAAFDNAACVESSQPGMLTGQDNEYTFLPLSVRSQMSRSRAGRYDRNYGKAWATITGYNTRSGIGGGRAHISDFYRDPKVAAELDAFTAHFEPVEHQLGAVVFFYGIPAGIEVMPSADYWRHYWPMLIRGCYAAELVSLRRQTQKLWTIRFPEEVQGSLMRTLENFEFEFLAELGKAADALEVQRNPVTYQRILGCGLSEVKVVGKAMGDLLAIEDAAVYGSIPLGVQN